MLAGGAVSSAAAVTNLVAVTLGNFVGGAAIAIGFWLAFLRRDGQQMPRIGLGSVGSVLGAAGHRARYAVNRLLRQC